MAQGRAGHIAQVIAYEVEQSLRRLGTDYLDLYYTHIDDRTTPLEETLEALNRLVQAGMVRQIGCSNMVTWRIERAKQISWAHGWATYCCMQQRHTLLRTNPGADLGGQVAASDELLDYCSANDDLTLLAYSPLLAGAYTRAGRPLGAEYHGPVNEVRLATLRAVAAETGATPNQVVLAWMPQGKPTIIPIIAASTPQQLQENLGAQQVALSAAQIERLNNIVM